MIILSSPAKYLTLKLKIVFSLFLFFIAFAAQTANPLDVAINEVAWMGTANSANDEWIELYNNSQNPINLDSWQLIAQDGTPKINLSGTIPANGFYLLERTDDNTVPGILADKIYTGALGNSGDDLKLYDNLNNLVDEINCSEKWLAGNNTTKQTMEKTSAGWQTSKEPGGTPKAENSIVIQTEPQLQTKSDEPVVDDSRQQAYPTGIVINEIMPSPEGPDETEEWIEIFNQNNFEVDLSDWKITDTAGKTNTFVFPPGTKIPTQGFLVLFRPTTKITLNNDEDGLLLIQPNGNILDSVNYQKAPQGQSYNRAESGWVWNFALTPNSVNKTSLPAAQNEISQKERTEPDKELQKNQSQKQQLAALGEQLPKTFDSLRVFLIALGLAIFSGVIILIIKRKLKDASDID